MEIFNKEKFGNLHELFIAKLQALYDVEQQLVEALPTMIKNAANPELRDALADHLEETRNQITRIELALSSVGAEVVRSESEGIKGIIKDGEWLMDRTATKAAGDAGIVAAAQYVEHYEIAGYGAAAEWADVMGHKEAAKLLKETLAEEEAADERLTALAETEINQEANEMVPA